MNYSIKGKRVFITGGTGTWGQEFTRILLEQGAETIRIMSRGEYRQVEMRRAFQQHANISYVIGDIRDLPRLLAVTRGYDVIIHLAALKHVPVVEENARESLMTNTLGTQNVIDAVIANGIECCLYVSSDKAVNPLNFYGVTKLAAERMVVIVNQESTSRFITFRAGNVMGSAGSVVPIFQETLSTQNSIKITDPNMTRFFIAKGEVVRLGLRAISNGLGGEIFIPHMKSTSLETLSKIMIRRLGRGKVQVDHIGVRPGEKIHEQLMSSDESARARRLDSLWVVLPHFVPPDLENHYRDDPRVDFVEYASNTAPRFSEKELEDLLESESFLVRQAFHSHSQLYFKKNEFEFH